jgi:hypothetical protein
VDSKLPAACEALGVVDEINFHVDRSTHLINGCSDCLQEGLPQDDGGLLTMIHIHDHEINQGRRILEFDQYIICYPVGMNHSGICQL